MRILYVSTMCAPETFGRIFKESGKKPGQADQKFHRLLITGLAAARVDWGIEALSVLPLAPTSHRRRLWRQRSDSMNGIAVHYCPVINIKFIKWCVQFVGCFLAVLAWIFRHRKEEKRIVFGILNYTSSFAALLAGKAAGAKTVAVVTDVPGHMRNDDPESFSRGKRLMIKLALWSFAQCHGFLLLTSQMNSVLNRYERPSIIIEGLVDCRMVTIQNVLAEKENKRIVLYAGQLHKIYGIGQLVEAFRLLKAADLELHLYGDGDMVNEIREHSREDPRIVYKGVVDNETVVRMECKATLLVNPRNSVGEFTKYSFPSKNIEYMVSGTPLITTRLAGIPAEYDDYVFYFEGESAEKMAEKLSEILSMPKEALHEFGLRARAFVLDRKSNVIQGARLASFLERM